MIKYIVNFGLVIQISSRFHLKQSMKIKISGMSLQRNMPTLIMQESNNGQMINVKRSTKFVISIYVQKRHTNDFHNIKSSY